MSSSGASGANETHQQPQPQPKPTDAELGYLLPDLRRPLDVDAWLARVPANATCKGLVAESVLDALPPGASITTTKFAPFRDYPMRDILQLKVAAARALRPDAPLREGLAAVGRTLFPRFVSSLLGRVMYGVFGRNVSSILRMANKSYEQMQNTGRVVTTVLSPTSVQLHFTNCWTFLDAYHVGVLEGTLSTCKVDGTVLVKTNDDSDGILLVRWQPRVG